MKTIMTIFTILISLSACKINSEYTNGEEFFEMQEPEMLLDNEHPNTNLEDNDIYLPGSEFTYDYKFFDKDIEQRCYVGLDSIGKQAYLLENGREKSNYVRLDNVKLYVYRGKGDISLAESQSIIKYDYLVNDRRFFFGERTGVAENSDAFFLHPPRGHCFITTCLHPFPYLKLPLSVGKTWNSYFSIPPYAYKDEFLKDMMLAFPPDLDMNYEVKSLEKINTVLGKIECFKILGEASHDNKVITEVEIYFNYEYGFSKLDYFNYLDSSRLVLELKSINR